MTITGGSALSKEDIDRMVRDAEQYADEDRKRREEVDLRNQAESLVYSTEKFLGENAEKIGEEIRTEVQGDVDELKQSLDGTDVEAVKAALNKLGESSQKMGAAMYADAQGAGGDGPTDAGQDGQEDVVDAEIVDDAPGDDTAGEAK